jgi:hypothetical protein
MTNYIEILFWTIALTWVVVQWFKIKNVKVVNDLWRVK